MSDDRVNLRGREARTALLIRVAALAPLVAFGLAYAMHEPLRRSLHEGTALLVAADTGGLRRWGEGLGWWAPAATSFLMVVQAIAAPIPAVVVTVTNSLLFGPFAGGLLSIASATFAAAVCYAIARLLGNAVVARFLSPGKIARAEAFMARHGTAAVLVARLLPFVPFDPISYAAGLARLPLWSFTWATFLGQVPAGMTYSYLAQEVGRPARLLPLAAGAFAALLVLGWTCRRLFLPRPGEVDGADVPPPP